jgi:CheY-like chemotaxis protein
MPQMTGAESAIEIKKRNPKTKIVAQSAYATENERDEFVDIFDDFIDKPIDIKILIETLKKYHIPVPNEKSIC